MNTKACYVQLIPRRVNHIVFVITALAMTCVRSVIFRFRLDELTPTPRLPCCLNGLPSLLRVTGVTPGFLQVFTLHCRDN